MNSKFPVLSVISIILIIVGWLAAIYGAYMFLYEGVMEPNMRGHSFGHRDLIQLGQGLGSFILGLIIAAFGEIIKVLFAIEENTRKGSMLMEEKK